MALQDGVASRRCLERPRRVRSDEAAEGDHIYVEGTLVSSTFEKEFGKGKSKITVPFKAWQVKADSIRKLNRAKKEQAPEFSLTPAGTKNPGHVNPPLNIFSLSEGKC